MAAPRIRLGVNVDHVATLRNARGGAHPDVIRAARIALAAGADGITAHLREDRRHIRDADIERLLKEISAPLNLEMAATEEMAELAARLKPVAACLVPERREERTTEGGLDAAGLAPVLSPVVRALGDAGVRVSLFIAPEAEQVAAAAELGAPAIELHTGTYHEACQRGDRRAIGTELQRLADAASAAAANGLAVHAGHGLDYANIRAVAGIPEIEEVNIGHFLVGEAVFVGLGAAIGRMRALLDEARRATAGA